MGLPAYLVKGPEGKGPGVGVGVAVGVGVGVGVGSGGGSVIVSFTGKSAEPVAELTVTLPK